MSTSPFDLYCLLDGRIDGQILCDEPMARHTTYRIGGPADLFIECATVGDVALVTKALAEHGIPWSVIGKGSNLLVADEGVKGAVVVLGDEFKNVDFDEEEGVLTAGAGISLSALTQSAFKKGYSGFEFAVGIPGTLGGALYMNAGTHEGHIGSVVRSLTVYNLQHGLLNRRGCDIPWDYRRSGIPAGDIVLEASLDVHPGDMSSIRAKMEAGLSRRKKSQPLSAPNAGSVFKNPPGESAGALIESVGLKGVTCGGAQISELHANFIVNTGNATAQDVVSLIVTARDKVKEAHGIELKPEIKFLGFE